MPDPVPGYNAASRIYSLSNFYLSGSFIYWQTSQDGMDIGVSQPSGNARTLPATLLFADPFWEPGFKVGAGAYISRHDDWALEVEYARLHGGNTELFTAANSPTGIISMNNWVHSQTNINARSVTSYWQMHYDMIDFYLSRSYMVGNFLDFSTHVGGRGGWIDQAFNLTMSIANSANVADQSRTSSDSWAVGLRGGVKTNWELGEGVRAIANVAGSVLYTSYKATHFQTSTVPAQPGTIQTSLDVSYPRPNMDIALGFGWTYSDSKFHFDFAATYDFNVFWSQNMMRYLVDLNADGMGTPGNLYFQGLTATAGFAF